MPSIAAAESTDQGEAAPVGSPAKPETGAPPLKPGEDPNDTNHMVTRDELSEAQKIIFATPQLASITSPTVLNYHFERKSKVKDDFSDDVKVKVFNIRPDGARDVGFEFFTGERKRNYPPVEGFHGNPLSMIYLQHDATELSKLTGGSMNYFRVSILYGFHNVATVADVEVNGPNGPIKAKRVSLSPYRDGKHAAQLGPVEKKSYEFVVSPEIPGQIYSIHTVVPPADGDQPDAPNTVEETLTFVGAEPLANAGATN